MKNVIIKCFDSKGKELPESIEVDVTDVKTIGAHFKSHWLGFAKIFLNSKTHQIEVI